MKMPFTVTATLLASKSIGKPQASSATVAVMGTFAHKTLPMFIWQSLH
jgi:hypothetical protein